MAKLRIGALLLSDQTAGEDPIVVDGMELLIADGRPIDKRSYPRLYRMLKPFNYCLPPQQGSVEGVDHYIVARRVKHIPKHPKGAQ